MKNIFFKNLLYKGAKGKKGDVGQSYKIPEGAIIAYDGIDTPEGYEEVESTGIYTTKNITEIGVYKASDYGVDGFTEINVNLEINYNWYYNEDKTLVVREKISDGSFRWYFDWFELTIQVPHASVPSNLQRFIMNQVMAICRIEGQAIQDFRIGFYNDTIRAWVPDLSSNALGKCRGIIESTYTGFDNPYTWEEPTFDPTNG